MDTEQFTPPVELQLSPDVVLPSSEQYHLTVQRVAAEIMAANLLNQHDSVLKKRGEVVSITEYWQQIVDVIQKALKANGKTNQVPGEGLDLRLSVGNVDHTIRVTVNGDYLNVQVAQVDTSDSKGVNAEQHLSISKPPDNMLNLDITQPMSINTTWGTMEKSGLQRNTVEIKNSAVDLVSEESPSTTFRFSLK